MNNTELELKIKEIINMDNYFDMVIAAKDFEKDYKSSDYYKVTKEPLMSVIKNAKMFYVSQLEGFGKRIQEVINGLDISKLNSLMDQMAQTFGQENEETKEFLKEYKEIFSNLNGANEE